MLKYLLMLPDGPSARGQIVLTYCWWEVGWKGERGERKVERNRERHRGRGDMQRPAWQDVVNTESSCFLWD